MSDKVMEDLTEMSRLKTLVVRSNTDIRNLARPYVQRAHQAYAEESSWLGWEFVGVVPEEKVLIVNLITYDERNPPLKKRTEIDLDIDEKEYQLALKLKEKYNL